MNGFSRDDEERLLDFLGRELGLFEQLLGLTERQAELLAEDDADAFGVSLGTSLGLIEEINGLHQESELLVQSYMSGSTGAGGEKSAAIEAETERVHEVILKCAGANDSNMTAAKEKAEDYIKQIGKLSLNRKSLGAYIQSVPNNSEIIDKKS